MTIDASKCYLMTHIEECKFLRMNMKNVHEEIMKEHESEKRT